MQTETLVIKEQAKAGDHLLTPEALAERWGLSPNTLANQRSRGQGPRYYKLPNRRVLYPEWAVFAYEVGKL